MKRILTAAMAAAFAGAMPAVQAQSIPTMEACAKWSSPTKGSFARNITGCDGGAIANLPNAFRADDDGVSPGPHITPEKPL